MGEPKEALGYGFACYSLVASLLNRFKGHPMRKVLLFLGLLFPSVAYGQGGSVNGGGIVVLSATGRPIGGATVTICAFGATGIPCSPTITVYTSPTLSVTASNPDVTDGNGNLFKYAAPGRYTYTVTGPGIIGTSYTATVAGSGGGDVLSSGNNVFTGANTMGKLNGVCIVDGVQNATLAAAITCAGSSGVIEIAMFAVPTFTTATIPVGVTLRFDGPACLNNSGTLTINGPIIAGNQQIFCGSGTIALGSLSNPINALWFPGATADVQINNAIAAAPSIGGFIDFRGYGATTQTIAATTTFGSTASFRTITGWFDRQTIFLCTILNNTPCWVVNGGSTLMGFGTGPANPISGGLTLNGNAQVSNLLLVTQNIGTNNSGGFVEGLTVQGAGGTSTVSDAICAVKNTIQLTKLTNVSCFAAGSTNVVVMKVYCTGANQSVTNLVFDNVYLDGAGGAGNRPLWIGGAAAGSITPVACTGTGSIQSIHVVQSLMAHPGTGGIPIVTVESSNGAAGSNTVGNINFTNNQMESKNAGDIGILDNGSESLHVENLYTSISGVAGADVIKISQPAGTLTDNVVIHGVDNQGNWTNTINNTILTKTVQNRLTWYSYNKNFSSANSSVWADGNGNEAIIDLLGFTSPRAFSHTETTAPAAAAGFDVCYGDSTAHAVKCSYNNGSFFNTPQVIVSGTSTLTANAALAAVTSQAAITTAGTGILTTDAIEWSYATAPTAGDSLCHVSPYPTAGNVNFVRTNPTAAAQNVSAIVINWRVIR